MVRAFPASSPAYSSPPLRIDVMMRYLEMSFKAVLACVYYSGNQKKRVGLAMARYSSCGTDTWPLQAQVYAFIAATGQMYRLFLPIPVWVAFYNQKEFGRTAFAFGHHWG